MKYKRFKIHVNTNWVGTDEHYIAIAENEEQLIPHAQQLAYDNFESHDGFGRMCEEHFDTDPNDLTPEQEEELCGIEGQGYEYYVEEYEGDGFDWAHMEMVHNQILEDGYGVYILRTYTNWCGEEREYLVITKDRDGHDDLFEMTAYDNFSDFSGIDGVLEDLFGGEDEYTDEQHEEAAQQEGDYFGWDLEDFDFNNGYDFTWYEVLVNESE